MARVKCYGHQVTGIDRTLGAPSLRIHPGSGSPGVATSGLSVRVHVHTAYSVCLLSLSVCDCHIDCCVARSAFTSLSRSIVDCFVSSSSVA